MLLAKTTKMSQSLANIHRPPRCLWYAGNLALLYSSKLMLAVVGSRQATDYAQLIIDRLLTPLLLKQVVIISGLALGVDSLAHQACLNHGGQTIAVLGSGLSQKVLYPTSNWLLAKKIINNNGLVISEYPPNQPPRAHFFPQRNRIIAGLSSFVLVVEAAQRSGALITANLALQEGRNVLAVPGHINHKNSQGTNFLLKTGAGLVTNETDLLAELDLLD